MTDPLTQQVEQWLNVGLLCGRSPHCPWEDHRQPLCEKCKAVALIRDLQADRERLQQERDKAESRVKELESRHPRYPFDFNVEKR